MAYGMGYKKKGNAPGKSPARYKDKQIPKSVRNSDAYFDAYYGRNKHGKDEHGNPKGSC